MCKHRHLYFCFNVIFTEYNLVGCPTLLKIAHTFSLFGDYSQLEKEEEGARSTLQLGKLEDFWETDEDLVAEDVGREVHTRLGLFGEGSLSNEPCQNPGCPK